MLLRREAVALVQADDAMRQRFELLTSVPGIAEIGALSCSASCLRCRCGSWSHMAG